jgi:hypothetical protein
MTFFIEVIELDWNLEWVLKVKSKGYRDPSQKTIKLRGLSSRANYTDRAAAAGRRS